MTNLILITGVPASGKTALTIALSKRLGCPAFIKDVVKEELFNTLGCDNRKRSRELGVAAMEIIFAQTEFCLNNGLSCIIENTFKPEYHNDRIEKIKESTGCKIIQILCKGDGEILFERYKKRAPFRHKGHCDLETLEEFKPVIMNGRAEPLNCGGKLYEFDTTFINDNLIDNMVSIAERSISENN